LDRPTKRPIDEVIAAFEQLSKPLSNNTELNDFLSEYFGAAGSELAPVPSEDLTTDPTFLEHVNSTDIRDFISQVIDIWPDLTRQYVGAGNCTGCVSSFIPVNRTFVVAGGRFREPYYWDSFWIVEGLLRTQGSFTEIALNIIENFLDIINEVGFMPNGARQYYLNRSQPPLLTQMIRVYVEYTNDTSIIEKALPTLEREHQFFMNNRTVDVELDGETYTLNHYEVSNTQPRPESYYEDYTTANNESYYAESGIIYPGKPLNESERATLYSDLASGAESGWDYSSRWVKTPGDAVNDVYFPLRSLNTKEIVPVDLNAILYHNEVIIASFHNQTGNSSAAEAWAELASKRSEAMTAVMWDEDHFRYFDYNLTSSARNVYVLADEDSTEAERAGAPEGQMLSFNVAQFYPFWTGAAPNWLKNNPASVQRAYAPVADQLLRKAGTIPATNLQTGEQWDEPNAWPPHQYIVTAGLLNTPPTFGEDDPSYIWTQELALNLSQRYIDSTFCTWRVTGGDTEDLPQLEGADPAANGTMFEKYADNSTNAAGGGGEYEVVEGFGWSNGVLIWMGDVFGEVLKTPECGNITAATVNPDRKRKRSAVEMSHYDSKFVKRWQK
jgi:alpha,alpha-trehalase